MTTNEEEIKKRAEDFARKNKIKIAKEKTNPEIFPPEEFPVSVFMAGSPGAGKTESSKKLIEELTEDGHLALRIDIDELRPVFEDYKGDNSHLFIGSASIIADKIHDLALKNKQSFIFDGTLSNLGRARENIKRSLDKNRVIQIVYVYQEPKQAWKFVKDRETKEGRKIPKDAFIEQYFRARENTNTLKREFGGNIEVYLTIKNMDGTDLSYHQNIDSIDSYIPEKYNRADLKNIIL
ncbi:MAG: zeta toxin family protein [bacterium]